MKIKFKNRLPKVFSSLTFFCLIFIVGCVAANDTWKTYDFPEGKFKMQFPGQPEKQSQVVNSAIGELNMNIYVYDASKEKGDNYVYMVNYTDYPDTLVNSDDTTQLKTFYRNSIDGMANNVHGKLLTEKVVNYEKYSGREIRIEIKERGAIITSRMFLIANRIYIIEVITSTEKDFNTGIKKFLDSFKRD